jgi:hypothetical protein
MTLIEQVYYIVGKAATYLRGDLLTRILLHKPAYLTKILDNLDDELKFVRFRVLQKFAHALFHFQNSVSKE